MWVPPSISKKHTFMICSLENSHYYAWKTNLEKGSFFFISSYLLSATPPTPDAPHTLLTQWWAPYPTHPIADNVDNPLAHLWPLDNDCLFPHPSPSNHPCSSTHHAAPSPDTSAHPQTWPHTPTPSPDHSHPHGCPCLTTHTHAHTYHSHMFPHLTAHTVRATLLS
jgi:hypothetical protein